MFVRSIHFDDGKLPGSSTYFLALSSVSLGASQQLFFSVVDEAEQRVWLSSFKQQSLEAAQRKIDDSISCFALSQKLARAIGAPAGAAASSSLVSSVIKAGVVEKKNKKRYLVFSPAGLSYYVRQHGELRGHVAAADLTSVVVDGLCFEVGVSSQSKPLLFAAPSEQEALAWSEVLTQFLEGPTRKQTVQVLFDEGTRAVLDVKVFWCCCSV